MSVKPYEYDKERWETVVSDCGITLHKENVIPACERGTGKPIPGKVFGELIFTNREGVTLSPASSQHRKTATFPVPIGFPVWPTTTNGDLVSYRFATTTLSSLRSPPTHLSSPLRRKKIRAKYPRSPSRPLDTTNTSHVWLLSVGDDTYICGRCGKRINRLEKALDSHNPSACVPSGSKV